MDVLRSLTGSKPTVRKEELAKLEKFTKEFSLES